MQNAHTSILDMARRQGLLRPRDVEARGFSRMALSTLARQGKLGRSFGCFATSFADLPYLRERMGEGRLLFVDA